jgi:hypothetical protein
MSGEQLAPMAPPEVLSEDDVLQYTQRKRIELVDHMTVGGMPAEAKDRSTMLMALDGLDRQALTKQRLKTDEKIADSDRMAANIIGTIFSRLGKSPYERTIDGTSGEQPALLPPPKPDLGLLPAIDVVPGEMDQGTSELTYDSFTAKMGLQRAQDQAESQSHDQ